MSGHSKWAKVKYQKAVKDPKKSKAFSKLANLITVAAREGGDPESNPKLRLAVEKAKSIGMPKEKIERAIQRGTGQLEEGENLEEIFYEAYTPGGGALLIQTITENRNRTSNELRHLLNTYGAKLASGGSVRYLFQEKVKVQIDKKDWKEDYSLQAIEKGVEDLQEQQDKIILYVSPSAFPSFKNWIENEIKVPYQMEIDFLPHQTITISEETTRKQISELFEALNEHNDVEEFYSNIILS